eukprot:scaffold24_cov341-Pavlova_lutheri.AAC.26
MHPEAVVAPVWKGRGSLEVEAHLEPGSFDGCEGQICSQRTAMGRGRGQTDGRSVVETGMRTLRLEKNGARFQPELEDHHWRTQPSCDVGQPNPPSSASRVS